MKKALYSIYKALAQGILGDLALFIKHWQPLEWVIAS